METLSTLPILLIDDDPQLMCGMRNFGFPHVISLDEECKVMSLLAEQEVGAIVLDLSGARVCGLAILEQVVANYPDTPVIVVSATGDLELAVQCMQTGAIDYLAKPVENNRLASSLRRALETRSIQPEFSPKERDRFSEGVQHEWEGFADIVTQDPSMFEIFRYIEAIACSPQPVLITGETGTGKELIGSAVHRLSKRRGEFVTVNVAGLDDVLFSDTLFGHAKGAYTGADRPRDGLITTACDGTLVLDEIGELTTPSQVKLLRLLQDGTYYQLGADRPRTSGARIIGATNCDLAELVAAGTFRKDLYFRLRTHHLHLPPLRHRRNDIPLLADFFLNEAARVLGRSVPAVPRALYTLLQTYDFPGNIRELQAMIFDAVARRQGAVLSLQSLKEAMGRNPVAAASGLFADERLPGLREAEEALTEEALARSGGNQAIAAGMLGISRQALNKRLSRRRDSQSMNPPTVTSVGPY